MNNKEKQALIQKLLDLYFPNPKIPLVFTDPYTLLIATVLSSQTTDQMVNKVTPVLFAKAQTPQELLLLTPEEVQNIITPCGLSKQKTRHLFLLSKILKEKYRGKVPRTFASLEALPGVGHKTASVVLAFAFQKDTFPVDRHIHRLAKRWDLSSGKNVCQTEKDLKRFFLKKEWNKIHLQMILFGRKYCQAKRHSPTKCPICRHLP
ncbi:MAG: endonuclease III [Chlamydiota bacterium]